MSPLHPLGRAWARLPGPLRTVVISVTLAAGYYAAARFGLRYASIGRSISLVWPPTGIALAALTALGLRYWPSVAVGALLFICGAVWLWFLIRAILGVIYLARDEPYPRPYAWIA